MTVTGQHKRAVGVFSRRRDAEHALHELRDSGFPMDRISVIARDAHEGDLAGAEVRDRGNLADEAAKVGAVSGGALGTLTGLLVGLGVLAIPGIGPVMLAGATATALATTLAGGAIGAVAGGLLGALVGLGIPEERAKVYSDRVARGDYLVMVEGTDAEIARAEAILHHRGIEEYGVYNIPNARTTTATATPAATPVVTPTASTPVYSTTHPASTVAPSPTDSVIREPAGIDVQRSKYAIGYFRSQQRVEQAIAHLRQAGYPLNQVSLVAQRFEHPELFTGVDLRDRFDATRLGLPTDRAHFYNDHLRQGDYILIINGSEDEVHRAETILNQHPDQLQVYDPMQVNTNSVGTTTPASTASVTPTATHAPMAGDRSLQRQAIGFFSQRRDAEQAIEDLKAAGFPLSQVSLIAQKTDRQGSFGLVDMRDRLDNARLGLPENRISFLHNRVNRGDYLLIVRGTDTEIHQAGNILNRRGIQEFSLYDAPDVNRPASSSRATEPGHYLSDPGMMPASSQTQAVHPMHAHKRAIGVFAHRRDAEAALSELRDSGFAMNQVSIIAKNDDKAGNIAGVGTSAPEKTKTDEGAKAGAVAGGALGGLGGLLVGLGVLAIPGIGPVMLAGAAATALATALSGGAIGAVAGGLAGGLIGLGIPEDRAKHYSDRFQQGDYLVMVDGTEDQLRQAESILNRRGVRDWGVFDATAADRNATVGTTDGTTDATTPLRDRESFVTIIDHRHES